MDKSFDLDGLEVAYRDFAADLIRRSGLDPQRYPLVIAPKDEMFFNAVLPGYPGRPGAAFCRYVQSGLRTFRVYEQLARHLGGFAALNQVLDFGSGYGRLTRPLSQRLRREQLWVCDLYAEAVAWQAQTFGAIGLVSTAGPEMFGLREDFSIVFAGSVFSHLPDALFRGWLARLYELTPPQGLLAFTVHGATTAPEEEAVDDSGISFARRSESDSHDLGIYGMTFVTEAYVRGAIEQACGKAAASQARRFPRVAFESQDLYVVGGKGVDLHDLTVFAPPIGGFSRFREGAGWAGYAIEPNPGHEIATVELFVGERRLDVATPRDVHAHATSFFPGAPSPAVAWNFRPQPGHEAATLRATFTSTTGEQGHCYATGAIADREAPRS